MDASPDEPLDDDPPSALTAGEVKLLGRLSQVAIWLSRVPEKEVIERIIDAFECTEAEAYVWQAKAEHYLTLGVADVPQAARKGYALRLLELYSITKDHMVTDEVEITRKPTHLRVDPEGSKVPVMAEITKVKPKQFNVNAATLAYKLVREIAALQGVRSNSNVPMALSPIFNIQAMQVNNGANGNGTNGGAGQGPDGRSVAHMIEGMATAQLASMIGARVVSAPVHADSARRSSHTQEPVGSGQETNAEFVPDTPEARGDRGDIVEEAHARSAG